MIAFFIYLIKVSFWIAIWWLVYCFFLRKETFYSFNRIYLMTGLVASFLIPLIKIYYPVEILIAQASIGANTENIQVPVFNQFNIYSILFYIYLFCVVFFIIRQLFLLWKINKMIRSNGFTAIDNYRLVNSPETKIPFSFYKYIFYNTPQIPEEEKQLILAHERSHIFQLHWIDLFITECICIFLWFNPFIWLYLRSIRENHEYLADKAVISNGYSPVYYQATLINRSFNATVIPFVNSFAYYKFKRISMMKKENSNPLKKLAVMLLIPATGFFLWAFSEPEYHFSIIESQQQPFIISISVSDTVAVDDSIVSEKIKTNVKTVSKTDSLRIRITSLQEQNEKRADERLDLMKEEINTASPLIIIDGEESTTSLNEISPDQIESISVLKDVSAVNSYGEKGKNGVVLITTKNNKKTIDISITVDDQSPIAIKGVGSIETSLIIIDEIISTYTDLKGLDPNQIEHISVLKDASAVNAYGEKAKDGVIIVTTKMFNNKETFTTCD